MKRLNFPAYILLIIILFFGGIEILILLLSRYTFPLGGSVENDPKRGYRLKPDIKVEMDAGKTLRNYWRYWKDTGYSVDINIDGQGFRGKEDSAAQDLLEIILAQLKR